MKIQKLINTIRNKHHLSQLQLAKLFGLRASQTISNIECGKAPLPLAHARILCRKFPAYRSAIVRAFVSDYRGKIVWALKARKKRVRRKKVVSNDIT